MRFCWPSFVAFCTMFSCTLSATTLPRGTSYTHLRSDNPRNDSETSQSKLLKQAWPDDVQLGCKELRAKRFISDGFCTSLKPIKEVVCAGHCMPIKEQNMPWWAEFTKYWAKPKFKEWRCVEAVTKLKKVQLMCENGETRSYKIKIVKSCKCKSYDREPNRTDGHDMKVNRPKRKTKTQKEKDRKRKERKEKREQRRLRRLNRNRKDSKRRRPKRPHSDSVTNSKTRRTSIVNTASVSQRGQNTTISDDETS